MPSSPFPHLLKDIVIDLLFFLAMAYELIRECLLVIRHSPSSRYIPRGEIRTWATTGSA